jgi:hypothetical protein
MTRAEMLQAAAIWAAEEFERRTRLIAADDPSVSPDWIIPGYRVAWSEFCSKLGDLGWPKQASGIADVVDARYGAQPLFDRELQRRGLLRVMRGKETADQYVARVPKR